MKLYFFRHAEASYDAPSDQERPLTERGKHRTQTAARVMQKLGIAPAHLFSSPRLRARQTADIVADALGLEVEMRDEVDFSFNPESVRTLIRGLTENDDVMFVGHNPSMSEVITHLTGADLALKKGGLARLDLYKPDSLGCELVWLIAPKVFDALGQ